ncbi:hypothetical protein SDC9_52620 [bioreactor metagenome]|uniref:Uncharacterized protein n=1 Tax=bioreactor metagenome TaxID=1076179 RepID=A0A644WS31_9ZZZZ
MVFDYFKSRELFETKPDEVCYIPENNEGDIEDRYTRNDIVEMCDGDELKADIVFDLLSWEYPGCILDQWDEEDDEALEELRRERNG